MRIEEMTTQELLATALKINRDDESVKELVAKYASARSLYQAPVAELTKIKGIGARKALMLKVIMELGLRIAAPAKENPAAITSPDDVVELLQVRMALYDREHFVAVLLNTKNRVISLETISIGSLNSSLVHPREVFKSAIKASASSIIIAHNHPSGDPTPSSEDLTITQRLVEAGEIIGISILDHIIIGSYYLSFREKGFI